MGTDIPKILIAEPIYQGLVPQVYANRIAFWEKTFQRQYLVGSGMTINGISSGLVKQYMVNPMPIGPRNAIRLARQKAIAEALASGATHILFMDDDVIVPPTILGDLLRVDGDVVGGLMYKDDGSPIVFRSTCTFSEEPWFDHPTDKAFECAAVGAGCMLINMAVIEKIRKSPYSPEHWLFNYDVTDRSMDVLFCRMVHNAGGSVWCLPHPICKQIKHY